MEYIFEKRVVGITRTNGKDVTGKSKSMSVCLSGIIRTGEERYGWTVYGSL